MEESLRSLSASFLLRCQKPMLIMTNAIPIGRNTPILLLTAVSIMKINPLIEKSIAAFLCDFEFFDSLLFTMKVPLPEVTLSLFHVPFGSQ
ncbi:hypothetical protein ACFLXH_02700 [Chloroflexota bacterium]